MTFISTVFALLRRIPIGFTILFLLSIAASSTAGSVLLWPVLPMAVGSFYLDLLASSPLLIALLITILLLVGPMLLLSIVALSYNVAVLLYRVLRRKTNWSRLLNRIV